MQHQCRVGGCKKLPIAGTREKGEESNWERRLDCARRFGLLWEIPEVVGCDVHRDFREILCLGCTGLQAAYQRANLLGVERAWKLCSMIDAEDGAVG